MKILITGFEPFGGETINPALEAIKKIKPKYDAHEVFIGTLPVVFHKSIQVLDALIQKYDPEIVICFGQAGGRTQISIERIGINIDDARIPDNEAQTPIDEPIFLGGPAAYFSNLPVKAIAKAICDAGIPASVSNSAGTYVCNHILYGLCDLIDKKYNHIRGGFIHLPYAPEQVVKTPHIPSMSINDMVKAIEIIIETSVHVSDDIKTIGGTIH